MADPPPDVCYGTGAGTACTCRNAGSRSFCAGAPRTCFVFGRELGGTVKTDAHPGGRSGRGNRIHTGPVVYARFRRSIYLFPVLSGRGSLERHFESIEDDNSSASIVFNHLAAEA